MLIATVRTADFSLSSSATSDLGSLPSVQFATARAAADRMISASSLIAAINGSAARLMPSSPISLIAPSLWLRISTSISFNRLSTAAATSGLVRHLGSMFANASLISATGEFVRHRALSSGPIAFREPIRPSTSAAAPMSASGESVSTPNRRLPARLPAAVFSQFGSANSNAFRGASAFRLLWILDTMQSSSGSTALFARNSPSIIAAFVRIDSEPSFSLAVNPSTARVAIWLRRQSGSILPRASLPAVCTPESGLHRARINAGMARELPMRPRIIAARAPAGACSPLRARIRGSIIFRAAADFAHFGSAADSAVISKSAMPRSPIGLMATISSGETASLPAIFTIIAMLRFRIPAEGSQTRPHNVGRYARIWEDFAQLGSIFPRAVS